MKENSEKLTYLLNNLEYHISMDAYNVLNDSEADPQYSAVTTANLIKCYIDVKRSLGEPTPYGTVEEYLYDICFTSEDVKLFEKKRAAEACYYVGKQY